MNTELLEEVLEGFEMRGYHVGLNTILSQTIHKQRKYKEQLSDDELVMLCVLILTFILESSYLEQHVTLKDIEGLLTMVWEDIYKVSLSAKASKELAEFLVVEVLQNNGTPFLFKTYDFAQKKTKELGFRLLKDVKKDINGYRQNVYVLEKQGRQLLYGTKEIQDSYGVNYEEIKLAYLIRKRRFAQANLVAIEACKLAKDLLSEMSSFIQKMRRGFYPALENEYSSVYEGAFESLREKKDFAEDLKHTINQIYDEIQRDIQNKDRLKNLDEVIAVQKTLSRLLALHQQLLTMMMNLNRTYDDAVAKFPLFQTVGLKFEEDVLNSVEENPVNIFKLYDLFRSLGKPKFSPIVNPLVFYQNQASLKQRTEVTKVVEVDLTQNEIQNEFLMAQQQRLTKQKEEMAHICRAFLKELETYHGTFELKDWIATLEACDDPLTMSWFGGETFRYVLAILFNENKVIDFPRLKEMQSKLQLVQDVVSVDLALAELIDEIPYLKRLKVTRMEQPQNPYEEFEYAYVVQTDGVFKTFVVRLNNLIVKGEE